MSSSEAFPLGHSDRSHELRDRVRSCLGQMKTNSDAQTIDDIIILAREAFCVSSVNETPSEKIDAILLLASALRARYTCSDEPSWVEESIDLGRKALALSGAAAGNQYRARCCENLSESLELIYERTHDDTFLNEAIDLQREVHDLCPEGHQDRLSSCEILAKSLTMCYERTGNIRLLDETIDLERETLNLRPPGHPDCAISYTNLAVSLTTRFERTDDICLLDEIIALERTALALRPEGHPLRSSCCENLASSLKVHYERSGDDCILDEVIHLQRKALCLQAEGYPDRSASCGDLATSLITRYKHTGDDLLLDEAIKLQREALNLRPAGNPYRSVSCVNLGNSLTMYYERTSDVGFLDEAIDLDREALHLLSAASPLRSSYCGNLATGLITRYKRTGDVRLLDEAINLQREALDLRPEGHPDRSLSCANLAISLKALYERSNDDLLLDEAINLQRDALDLRPEGHADRAISCANLANSLLMGYERTGDVDLLDETIDLEREVLTLRPPGHPNRPVSCANLAISLKTLYERADDNALLHDIFTLLQEVVATASKHVVWRHLCILAWVHLQKPNVFHDVNRAILYLSQSLENEHDNTILFVQVFIEYLDNIWGFNTEGKCIKLEAIYQRLVNLLPLLVHPALDLQPQLRALRDCTRLGSDALVNAVLAGHCTSGLEILDLAQGVIWSQSLHRRDPQLKDVPEPLASDLQHCLRAIAEGSTNESHDAKLVARTPYDTLHANSSHVYTLLREIRALPGLDRFMLGETWDNLRTAASDHPVVVLVGARGHYYALILAASLANGHEVLSLDLIDEDLKSLSFTPGSARAHRSAATPDGTPEEGDRAGLKKTERVYSKPLDVQLRTLWHKVVKPVLARLDLKVSHRCTSMVCACAEKKRTR
jgi:hypothetical protein